MVRKLVEEKYGETAKLFKHGRNLDLRRHIYSCVCACVSVYRSALRLQISLFEFFLYFCASLDSFSFFVKSTLLAYVRYLYFS